MDAMRETLNVERETFMVYAVSMEKLLSTREKGVYRSVALKNRTQNLDFWHEWKALPMARS